MIPLSLSSPFFFFVGEDWLKLPQMKKVKWKSSARHFNGLFRAMKSFLARASAAKPGLGLGLKQVLIH